MVQKSDTLALSRNIIWMVDRKIGRVIESYHESVMRHLPNYIQSKLLLTFLDAYSFLLDLKSNLKFTLNVIQIEISSIDLKNKDLFLSIVC